MIFKNSKNIGIIPKFFILIAVFLIFESLIIFGLGRFAWQKIKQYRMNIVEQNLNIRQSMDREINAKKLSDKLNKIEPELENFSQIFINRNRELEFITTLENAATHNNVSQKIALDLAKNPDNQTLQKVPLALTAQGNYYNILKYLNELENLNYYLNIISLDFNSGVISTNADGGQTRNITLQIQANTYWR